MLASEAAGGKYLAFLTIVAITCTRYLHTYTSTQVAYSRILVMYCTFKIGNRTVFINNPNPNIIIYLQTKCKTIRKKKSPPIVAKRDLCKEQIFDSEGSIRNLSGFPPATSQRPRWDVALPPVGRCTTFRGKKKKTTPLP